MATVPNAPTGLTPGNSLRLAAIDVGSNSIHMIVAQIDADGGVTTLWRLKEPVGLGRMSFPSHRLNKEAMDRAIATLARFQQAAVQRQCEKIVAVATSAIREATNGGDFIERCKRELKLYIKVVSAREEARLIYLAVRHALPLTTKPGLIIDIGGGSVEFIVGDGKRAGMLESRKLGAARMTARYVKSDPISEDDQNKLTKHYRAELVPLAAQAAILKPDFAIGTSGTLENIAAMCAGGQEAEAGTPRIIERKALEKLVKSLLPMTSAQRARLPGLDDGRKDQIVAGSLLVAKIFRQFDLKRLTICPAALREGILLDYLTRHVPDLQIRREVPDPRRRSVIDLARRCDWHQSHSEQVANLTLQLFDQTARIHKLGPLERELIEYAALLHDIGWHIDRRKHHKHSAYLILNGDLRDFSRDEVEIIANITRYHRKQTPTVKHKSYTRLNIHQQQVVNVGSALLRIADGLDRSHASVVQTIRSKWEDDRLTLRLLTRADAELEVWGARRKRQWFEKVLGRKLRFQTAEA